MNVKRKRRAWWRACPIRAAQENMTVGLYCPVGNISGVSRCNNTVHKRVLTNTWTWAESENLHSGESGWREPQWWGTCQLCRLNVKILNIERECQIPLAPPFNLHQISVRGPSGNAGLGCEGVGMKTAFRAEKQAEGGKAGVGEWMIGAENKIMIRQETYLQRNSNCLNLMFYDVNLKAN